MLDYDISKRGGFTLSEFVYRSIKEDIFSGALDAGEHLPSKRKLAAKLGVSLITVEAAYSQLIAEGYVYAEQRRGYYVARLPKLPASFARLEPSTTEELRSSCPALDAFGQAFILPSDGDNGPGSIAKGGLIADFTRPAGADAQEICTLWSKNLRSALAHEPETELYGVYPPQGSLRLRKAIAHYLARARGMNVAPEHIVVGAGSQVLYALVSIMMTRHCPVAVENPGYRRLMGIYSALGHDVRPLQMDTEGMRFDLLDSSDALVAHVMPSHQFPTGKVMSIARRYELLGWAARNAERLIVEDDYDWEFRFAGRPIPSLQSIDTTQSVVYLSTFSKSLGPALKVAFAVFPPRLMERFDKAFSFLSCTVSSIDQVALANLIEGGSYERHLNRYRKKSRAVRDALIDGLKCSSIGGRVTVQEEDSGLHFILGVECATSAEQIARDALNLGVKLAPISSYLMPPEDAKSLASLAGGGAAARFVMQYDGVALRDVPKIVEILEKACCSPGC